MGATGGFDASWRWSVPRPWIERAIGVGSRSTAGSQEIPIRLVKSGCGFPVTRSAGPPLILRPQRRGALPDWAEAGPFAPVLPGTATGAGRPTAGMVGDGTPPGRTEGTGVETKPRALIAPFWEAPGTLAKAGFTGFNGRPPAAKNWEAFWP